MIAILWLRFLWLKEVPRWEKYTQYFFLANINQNLVCAELILNPDHRVINRERNLYATQTCHSRGLYVVQYSKKALKNKTVCRFPFYKNNYGVYKLIYLLNK